METAKAAKNAKNTTEMVRRCRACGCTDADCSYCIYRTGAPCHWVEEDLCSACLEHGFTALVRIKRGSDNVASARVGGRTYRRSCTESGQQAAARLAEKIVLAVRADRGRIERYRTLSIHDARALVWLRFRLPDANQEA